METSEIEKSKAYTTEELIGYSINAKVIRPILIKPAINISAISFEGKNESIEKTTPFESYIQIIDGQVELLINEESYVLSKGESIVIPGHASHSFKPKEHFKMIQTIIKSGYE